MPLDFIPPEGFENTVEFVSKPANGSIARQKIMSLLNQIKNYINGLETSGTWTPVLYGETTAGTQTYTAQNEGKYYKYGKLVYVQARVAISAKDAAMAGNVRVSGLPFTPVSGFSKSCLTVGLLQGIDYAAGFSWIAAELQTNNTITLVKNGDNILPLFVQSSEVLSNFTLDVSGVYFTA